MTSQLAAAVVNASPLLERKEHLPTLNQSLQLEESKPPLRSRSAIFVIVLFLGLFIIWAAITPVNEVTVAQGQVIPTGFIKSIQHLQGGMMSELLVQEGDDVKAGDVLVTMDGKATQSELEQIKIRDVALRIKAERLRALGLDQHPNFDSFDPHFKNLVDDQKAIYDMQVLNRDGEIAVIENKIEQLKALLILQLGQERDIHEQVEIIKRDRDISKELFDKRLRTRTDYRKSEENYSKIQRDLHSVMNQTHQTRQSIAEEENKLLELKAHLRNEALNEMGNVTKEIAETQEAIHKIQDQVDRLTIVAPISGIVESIKVTAENGVIQPGAEIMQIAPQEKPEVVVHVDPKDIGNIKPEQKVVVKVSADDYARHGRISGKLREISSSTFQDEKINNNKPFYKAYVTLDQDYVGTDPKINHISPGMAVQADIFTGTKKLLLYLINPVYKAVSTPFRKRSAAKDTTTDLTGSH